MKLIIAGSRHFEDWAVYGELVKMRIERIGGKERSHVINQATEIVSGGATGVDKAGELYGDFYDVPVKVFPAEWRKYQNRAGPIRNNKMAVYADALLLIWDGESRGSAHMKQAMLALGKPVYEVKFKELGHETVK